MIKKNFYMNLNQHRVLLVDSQYDHFRICMSYYLDKKNQCFKCNKKKL